MTFDRSSGRARRELLDVLKVFLIGRRGDVREIYSSLFLQPQTLRNGIESRLMEEGLRPSCPDTELLESFRHRPPIARYWNHPGRRTVLCLSRNRKTFPRIFPLTRACDFHYWYCDCRDSERSEESHG